MFSKAFYFILLSFTKTNKLNFGIKFEIKQWDFISILSFRFDCGKKQFDN